MRRLVLLALLVSMPLPLAAKRVTVAQLEQSLTADRSTLKPDAQIARQIGGMELSERLTKPTLDRLTAQLDAGPQAVLALQLLADQSDFLDPPAAELPATAPPDDASRQRMLGAARSYVAQVLPRLPNLLATRTTNRYDDSPQAVRNEWPVRAGLHLVGTSSQETSIRDERDSQSPIKGSAFWQAQTGMISGGEFGSTLAMILTDTVEGKITWSHWEQTAAGLAAVFHYSVPKSASHYEVIGSQTQPASFGRGPRHTARNTIIRSKPGYRGSLWVDPVTGTIFRLTLEADAQGSTTFRRADILVQYGPVQIGGSEFICPVRSVALSVAFADAQVILGDAPTQWLNETLFTGYHRFASTVRILKDTGTP